MDQRTAPAEDVAAEVESQPVEMQTQDEQPTEAEAVQPDGKPAKKPARRGKGNKGVAATEDESK